MNTRPSLQNTEEWSTSIRKYRAQNVVIGQAIRCRMMNRPNVLNKSNAKLIVKFNPRFNLFGAAPKMFTQRTH